MMNATQSISNFQVPEGGMLLNLRHFSGGSLTVLNYIPEGLRGFYAWFKSYDYPENPDLFLEQLLQDIQATKFPPRSGIVAPYHQVQLSSTGDMPDGKKEALKSAIKDPQFLKTLKTGLQNALLFQSPLYIGKSFNLRKRIASHLSATSLLRARLSESGINIDRTLLFIFPIMDDEEHPTTQNPATTMEDEEGENLDSLDIKMSSELLLEEIFSRLFLPHFALRIG